MNNLKNVEFRLHGDIAPISTVIKTGANGRLITLFEDKSKKGKPEYYNRAIRHCPNEKSVYIDEQSEFAVVEPIVFDKGYFTVTPRQPATLKFLELHPHNVANGGKLFEKVDVEANAVEALEEEDLIYDLKTVVKQKEKEEEGLVSLQALAAVIEGSYAIVKDMKMSQLRQIIYRAINTNPYAFIDEDNNPTLFEGETQRKFITLKAIGEGLIVLSTDGRTFTWGDNKASIVSVPSGQEPRQYFSEYLETDDGMLVLEKLMKML